MSKVEISKEWAEMIEVLKKQGVSFAGALDYFLNEDLNLNGVKLNNDNITVEEFSRAYLNGYTVEQTPQDIVEEKYNELSQDIEDTVFRVADSPINRALGFLAGVEYVNNVMKLGLKLD